MEDLIVEKVAEGIKELYQVEVNTSQIQVQKTRKEFDGDLTVVVFPFLKASKKSPEQTGEDLGNYLKAQIDDITDFNVVKGFLNFSISSSYWLSLFDQIAATENFGSAAEASGKTYMVEYASPNTNKPLHLGHLRNVFLGFSVAQILKANGHKVVKTQIVNDRGIHICKSMLAWQKFGNGATPESLNMKGDKLVGKYYVEFDNVYKTEIAELVASGMDENTAKKEAPIFKEAQEMLLKWESKDEEIYSLWETMNQWVFDGWEYTFNQMGVDFDVEYFESKTYLLGKDVVEKGLADGVFYQKEDGSIWCPLESEKMDDKLLLRADGTSVYMTQDIGTAIERYNQYGFDGLIYTVGNEQNHHFKVLFTILKKLGFSWAEECYHLSYGMMELPEGKMKTREGTVVDADDLMEAVVQDAKQMTQERGAIDEMTAEEKEKLYDMIGKGGLKYYLLKVDPKKTMLFNPEESIDLNGNTGPFIQYAHARIQSLLAKAESLGHTKEYGEVEMNAKEQDLIKLINDYPLIIKEAGNSYSPAVLANYIYDLVKDFNNFYQTVDILREEDKNKLGFRLQLSETIGKVINSGMKLLGVNVPNKM
jgi:arginyl-tRNA synthetase